jgi:small conductance mechanosensitive channel
MPSLLAHLKDPTRIVVIIAIVVGAHLTVIVVRMLGSKLMSALPQASLAKARSLAGLLTSFVIFGLYFTALGLVLNEFGVSLKAYLASASVLGLAIGFGSQGLVQDVVTGLTLIFSDLIDLDDMVEISGQTGLVQKIGMRFTVIKNHLGAEVYIPNRTITSVINYPRGYVRCLVDITLSADPEPAKQVAKMIEPIVTATFEQLSGIFITPPSMEGIIKTQAGKAFLRVKFRIWPGRGTPLETNLKQEIVQSLKQLDPNYADWMVAINYEVEKQSIPLTFRDFPRKKQVNL